MKSIAIGLLTVILAVIIIEPLVEVANVMREKITISSAISNALKAANNRSLEITSLRDRDVTLDESLYVEYFAEAFEDALNLSHLETKDNHLLFRSNDGQYNDFAVTINIQTQSELETDQLITKINIRAVSEYNFKTKRLKMLGGSIHNSYELVTERISLLKLRN
ncbi:hypothetical protein EDC19_2416 [Natranaerovirga hydrolytica]|uniref:Uncharacterized protein n=1 Tax=Natranaerovirga hydrolytica TaxID=680378 RepID=A0A4R1MES1_9FIRM|nr:hypothetical protein [Natranaerovirga hydrolytica]TCK90647.1 hypothetical protein EDC19_2416 [Natranaerovirga hydrolytica]